MLSLDARGSLLARALERGHLVEIDTVPGIEALDYRREMAPRLFAEVEISSSQGEGLFCSMWKTYS